MTSNSQVDSGTTDIQSSNNGIWINPKCYLSLQLKHIFPQEYLYISLLISMDTSYPSNTYGHLVPKYGSMSKDPGITMKRYFHISSAIRTLIYLANCN